MQWIQTFAGMLGSIVPAGAAFAVAAPIAPIVLGSEAAAATYAGSVVQGAVAGYSCRSRDETKGSRYFHESVSATRPDRRRLYAFRFWDF